MKRLSINEIEEIESRLSSSGATQQDVENLIYTARQLLSKERGKSTLSKPENKSGKEPKPKRTKRAPKSLTAEVFTDGACSGNPGPGGWGAIVRIDGKDKELSGGEADTTNNRMELIAVIEALRVLHAASTVVLTTDSKYVKDGITDWIHNWKKNGWKNSNKKPVKNADLWRELDALNQKHTIEWRWVRGHNGHPENERCDKLARKWT